MTEPTNPTETTKTGRGPTSAEVKFAKLVRELTGDADILAELRNGATAKAARENAKKHRADAKESDRQAGACDDLAAVLARVEELPEALRKALVVVLKPAEETS